MRLKVPKSTILWPNLEELLEWTRFLICFSLWAFLLYLIFAALFKYVYGLEGS